jgi:hypothetical protein
VAEGLVHAFISAKGGRIDISRAMHEPLGDVSGVKLAAAAAGKAAGFVAEVLKRCPDASFHDVEVGAHFVVLACSSLSQAAVTDHTNSLDPKTLGAHMRTMVLGYPLETLQIDTRTKVRLPV